MQKYAAIGPIAFHLPPKVEDNDALKAECPKWDMDLIYKKTGIRCRHVAAPGEVRVRPGRAGRREAVPRTRH